MNMPVHREDEYRDRHRREEHRHGERRDDREDYKEDYRHGDVVFQKRRNFNDLEPNNNGKISTSVLGVAKSVLTGG